MKCNSKNVVLQKKVLCQYVSKRYDTSAFNWHKIRDYYGPKRCPITSTSWAPRFPLVGGREPPKISTPAYSSLPQEEDSLLQNEFEGVKRCDEYLSGSSIRLGSRTDVFRCILFLNRRFSVPKGTKNNVRAVSNPGNNGRPSAVAACVMKERNGNFDPGVG